MRDPAVEAAKRIWDELDHGATPWNPRLDIEHAAMVDAAREALQPFRDRHRPHDRPIPGTPHTEKVCGYCLGPKLWPCPDAFDAYREDELA